jgi:PAS domain S-box-containing protein
VPNIINAYYDREVPFATAVLATGRDFQNCKDEPIRIPGSIQRHGFFLLLDNTDAIVVAVSDNAEEFLDLPLKLILGSPIETVLERELLAAVCAIALVAEKSGVLAFLGSFTLRGELYSVVTHCIGQERVLEFERIDRLVSPELMNAVITNFVGQLTKVTGKKELCQALTRQVKDLTGFNRVLLYRFDDEGIGTVLVEESDGILPSYLDLRFPASDIPAQARALYISNTVRIIPNATYTPSPLRGLGGRPVATLDLSMSTLRSVSPIHLQYMHNMGTVASMSISIVCEGKLWGLVSCHHAEPRTVPYLVRSACDLLAKMVATQLTRIRTTDRLERMVHFNSVQRRILTLIAAGDDPIATMSSHVADLTQVTDSDGVALVVDGVCEASGDTPDVGTILKLVEWLASKSELTVFESSNLAKSIEWAHEISDVVSGLLAVRISDVRQRYVLWFRSEVVRSIRWAGEPDAAHDAGGTLNPRKSFQEWKELARGQSTPWTETEIESAREFRLAITTINLKRAEEAAEVSEARFQQLTHELPNLVWTADDDGQLTYVNQKWRDQGLGDTGLWYEQERVVEEDRVKCRELWKGAVEQGSAFEAEARFQRKTDDTERWNLVRAVAFLRADGSRAGWVGTCTDLTDRREREMALKMTEKLALTGRMTSVIAHEINNPLTSITNLLYLLNTEVRDNAPATNYIRMMETELDRISGITKQTLRWSRESTQQPELTTAGAIFQDILRLFAGKIRNRRINVTVVAGQEIALFVVIGQMQQVVANLVSNAIDAVQEHGGIWLEAILEGATIHIVVTDDGAGMSEEARRHLFQPFYTSKGDLGNGLGLYISHEIVERHKGKLSVESILGKGTVIRVILPAQYDEATGVWT